MEQTDEKSPCCCTPRSSAPSAGPESHIIAARSAERKPCQRAAPSCREVPNSAILSKKTLIADTRVLAVAKPYQNVCNHLKICTSAEVVLQKAAAAIAKPCFLPRNIATFDF